MSTNTRPRIYVASLSDYNAGRLHGVWIEVTDAETMHAEIDAMLKASPAGHAEEWSIHDTEGFEPYRVGENPDLAELAQIADGVEEHGTLFTALLNHLGSNAQETIDYLGDNYAGAHERLEDWAQEFVEETTDMTGIPDVVRYHIDWEGVARDFDLNGDIFTLEVNGGVHVFWNR